MLTCLFSCIKRCMYLRASQGGARCRRELLEGQIEIFHSISSPSDAKMLIDSVRILLGIFSLSFW